MSHPLPSLNALRAFAVSARLQSFKLAAEALFVTPSAVSQQVKGLEEHLDVALFQRTSQGIALTDAGKQLLPELEKAFTAIANAVNQVRNPIQQVLRVSAPPAFASLWLMHRLPEFESLHDSIICNVHSSLEAVDFTQGDFDCAIRAYFMTEQQTDNNDDAAIKRLKAANLESAKLLDLELFSVCNPNAVHDRDGNQAPPQKLEDLSRYQLLHYRDYSTWTMWARFRGVELDTYIGEVCQSVPALIDAVRQGRGVALVDSVNLQPDDSPAPLTQLFSDQTRYRLSLFLVAPPKQWGQEAVRTFREWLHASLETVEGYYGFNR